MQIELSHNKKIVFLLFEFALFGTLLGNLFANLFFETKPSDLVLINLFFQTTFFTLLGVKIGGYLGAAMEENACFQLDMGVLSSAGAFLGSVAFGLIGAALSGLFFSLPWLGIWSLEFAIALMTLLYFSMGKVRFIRLTPLNCCGEETDASNKPLSKQPLPMKHRVAILLTANFAVLLILVLMMAMAMKENLGASFMMSAMMWGMGGGMLGGMVSGWLVGILDEHQGLPEHDNPIMIAAMALMAGMMGGMLAGGIGGMMAVMGPALITSTLLGAILLLLTFYILLYEGKFKLQFSFTGQFAQKEENPMPDQLTTLQIKGMTCDHCGQSIEKGLKKLSGVKEVRVDIKGGRSEIIYDDALISLSQIRSKIADIGYEAE